MTLTEAASLFEIAGDVDMRSAKRAYLRRVKRFSPERDPQGFQETREAWEMVEMALRGGWFESALEHAAAEEGGEAGEDDAGDQGSDGESDEDATDESADADDDEAALAEYWARFWNAEEPEEALEAALEARRDFPDSSGGYWLLLQAYDVAEDEDAAIELLSEAMQSGKKEFLDELARRKASEVPADAFAEHRDEVMAAGNTSSILQLAVQHFEREEHVEGFKSVREVLRILKDAPGTAEPGSWVWIGAAFAAVAGHRTHGAALLGDMDQWVQKTGSAAYFSANEAILWAMLLEWVEVAEDLPETVASLMFEAMRDWNPQKAEDGLEHYARGNRAPSRVAKSILRSRAPTLDSIYGWTLMDVEVSEASGSKWDLPWWAIVLVAMFLIKAISSGDSCRDKAEDVIDTERLRMDRIELNEGREDGR